MIIGLEFILNHHLNGKDQQIADYNLRIARMNERFFEYLHSLGIQSCDIIKSTNKGKSYNGDIDPHSLSLVEQDSLFLDEIVWLSKSILLYCFLQGKLCYFDIYLRKFTQHLDERWIFFGHFG